MCPGITEQHAMMIDDPLLRSYLVNVHFEDIAHIDAHARNLNIGGFKADPDISVRQLSYGVSSVLMTN
jgi:hypothetical protein